MNYPKRPSYDTRCESCPAAALTRVRRWPIFTDGLICAGFRHCTKTRSSGVRPLNSRREPVWCPPRGSRRRSGIVTIAHEPANLDRSSRAQFAKSPFARSGAACSSRRGRGARRRWRARRYRCRVVTLRPSFMPPFMSFMPPFMPRLLTRVPPLLSDLVSCDRGRHRRRRDIRHFWRQCWSGHRRRCRGSGRRRRWFLAACGDERQSGRDHQRFS